MPVSQTRREAARRGVSTTMIAIVAATLSVVAPQSLSAFPQERDPREGEEEVEQADAGSEGEGSSHRWRVGGFVGAAFESSEGITSGPLFGGIVNRRLRGNWEAQGEFRAWLGNSRDTRGSERPREALGQETLPSRFDHEQWMGLLRFNYVIEVHEVHYYGTVGGGWSALRRTREDRTTEPDQGVLVSMESGLTHSLMTVAGFGVGVPVGRWTIRPELGWHLGHGVVSPQFTVNLLHALGR